MGMDSHEQVSIGCINSFSGSAKISALNDWLKPHSSKGKIEQSLE